MLQKAKRCCGAWRDEHRRCSRRRSRRHRRVSRPHRPFASPEGEGFYPRKWTMIARAALLAGISKKVTPHTLRHTYATNLLSHGADLRSVQELLGHKNVATTQIYTHVTNKRLRDIHEKFHDAPADGS